MNSTTPPKLPVWKTALDCYRLTWRHLGDFFRFAWPWLLGLSVINGLLSWLFYPVVRQHIAETGNGLISHVLLSVVLSTGVGAMIAVPWHRLLLLAEPASPTVNFNVDAQKRTYFFQALALIGILMIPTILGGLLSPDYPKPSGDESLSDSDFMVLFLLLGSMIFMPWLSRLWLILPGIAIGRRDTGISNVWATTRGNTWRIFWSGMLATFPLLFATGFAVYYTFSDIHGDLLASFPYRSKSEFTLNGVGTDLISMTVGMLYVTFLSLAYRHFFGPVEGAVSQTPVIPDATQHPS
jgi:hypothetical protein